MQLTRPSCFRKIDIPQPWPYHAGFSNRGILYCDTCSTVLKFDVYNPNYVAIVGDKHPWSLTPAEKAKLETHLAPCPNGGRFKFAAEPRCPHCGASLQSLLGGDIYFIELAAVVDGDRDETVWIHA